LIVKSKKTKEPLSLIFMDIDNFKNVVDKNGHMIASKTLQAIAGTIKRIIKEPSLAVAYGGDEFVLALPDYTKQGSFVKKLKIIKRQ
jgi:diguanylate cyclase (GGDEF)-like protein